MGWTYLHKDRGASVAEFFKKEFGWEQDGKKVTVLDVAVVGLRTAYLAIERKFEKDGQPYRDVFGMVCLLDYNNKDYHNFGYKGMEETMHPYYYDCPKRILDLLTPIDSDNANEWRKNCLERLAAKQARPKLKTGSYLKLAAPVTFSNGDKLDIFYIADAKRRDFRRTKNGYASYRISKRVLDRGFQVLTFDELQDQVGEKWEQMGIL